MKTSIQFGLVVLLTSMSYTVNAQCGAVGSGTSGGVLCLYTDSMNNCLYLGGGFQMSGNDSMNHCGMWNDSSFTPLGMGMNGTNDSVWCFTWFNGDLYVGGSFTYAGGVPANKIARWDGNSWFAVGDGFNDIVYSLAVYNGQLYAGGKFTASGSVTIGYTAYWDGTQWMQTGGGTNGTVRAMHVFNNYLYMGGAFTEAGGIIVNHICRWDGSGFFAVSNGFACSGMGQQQCSVNTLCSFNGNLFAGGSFHGGMNSMQNIAMWNGMNWTSMGNIQGGSGNSMVNTMCVYNGMLYVGGNFGSCGGQATSNIAEWNGTNWNAIGTGMNGSVNSMAVFNNKLYIGGMFTDAAGTTVNNIATYTKLTGITPQEIYSPYVVYFNTSNQSLQINWVQTDASPVVFKVYNIIGKEIYSADLGVLSGGNHSKEISINNLSEGIYITSFVAGKAKYINKVLITR